MYYTIRQWTAQGVSLPDKPSDLLELALNDAKRLNRSRYQMDAGRYHERARRRDDDKCGVCLAGARLWRAH